MDFTNLTAALFWAWTITSVQESQSDNWLPANAGTETPFTTRSGKRLLYCWQPLSGRHAYLDCDADMILSDADAQHWLS